MSSLPDLVPLFPLPNVVLFPRVSVPLHVFEPRYRQMLADAMAGSRIIGMVLLRPDWEHDYYGRPAIYPVGCAGQITQNQALPDGRSNIVLRGLTRFRVLSEEPDGLYRRAAVAALDDQAGDPAGLEAVRRRVMRALAQATDGPSRYVLQDDVPTELLVNALCQSLPLDPVERQSLLDCDSIPGRCERLIEILEFRRLEAASPSSGGVH